MVCNSVGENVVAFLLYCAVTFKIIFVVSASTITGVVDATLNGARAETRFDFCTEVKFSPVVHRKFLKFLKLPKLTPKV